MVKVIKEFKEFAMRGNVIDMGVGVLIGTAFGKIIDSLVTDILTPPLGLLLGKVHFNNLFITLSGDHYRTLKEATEAGAVTVNYGHFLDSVLHFLIVSFAIFVTVKQINKVKKSPIANLFQKDCPYCFSPVPQKALRCPKCTSFLDTTKQEPMKMDRKPKITYRAG